LQTFTRLFVVLAASLLPAAAMSNAADTANPANPSLRALVNGIESEAKQPEIELSEFAVSIDQNGTMAEFEIDAQLTNPSGNEVEGRFTMQLPRDAVLTGYSLDNDGVMIPGSLIDQPKARQVYEDEVRGNIDPGLAEISSGNKFETRVYPIAPQGSRRISLTFVTPVDTANGLSIPLETLGPVGIFRLNANVTGVKEAPSIVLTGAPPIEMVRDGRSWQTAPYVLSQTQISGALQLFGVSPRSDALASRHSSGDTFFTITDTATGINLTEEPPERVRVYWDVSRSRADALLDEERSLLMRFLQDLTPASVDLVTFASDAPQLDRFVGEDYSALATQLSDQTYRGATSFAGVGSIADGDADICLMFTDGGATLNLEQGFDADCPLVVVASGPNIDAQRIGRVAQNNGGQALFLNARNSAEILDQMKRLPVGVVSIRDAGGKRLDYRMLPAANGRWSVVGELGEWSEVTVRLSGTKRSERRRTYQINTARADRNNAAGALWASQEVARLSDTPADREKMQRLSERFQVASPTMAFLVLERPDQYISAEIEPPEGFSQEWLSSYETAKRAHEIGLKTVRDDRLEFIVERWEETKQWWNSQFDQDAVMRQQEQSTGQGRARSEDSEQASDAAAQAAAVEVDSLAPPPPPPAPPPPAPPPPSTTASEAPSEMYGIAGGDEDTIVVTGSRVPTTYQDTPVAVSAISAEELSPQARNVVQVNIADVLNKRPYFDALNEADPAQWLETLAAQEAEYGSAPGFYFDVAEWFRLKGETDLSRQLLLSALDLPASDDETLLIVAFRLERDGDFDTAIELLEALNARIDYRTQPKRILALTLAARARQSTGEARKNDLEQAFELLSEVVLSPTDGRYEGIETVALMELNSLIPLIDASGGSWSLDERLIGTLDADVRVVVEWTSADADLDLHVLEPSMENVYYGNQRSQLGGKLSNDMTSGYGPEEYVMRSAFAGDYLVSVHGFSGDRINPNGPGRAMVRLIRDFARADHSEQLIDAEVGFDRSNGDENDRSIATIEVAN